MERWRPNLLPGAVAGTIATIGSLLRSGRRLVALYACPRGRPARALAVELPPTPWADAPGSDPSGEVARQFVLDVRDTMAGRTLRDVAADAGIGHFTLQRILTGRAWPDLQTSARLEAGLDAALWTRRPA